MLCHKVLIVSPSRVLTAAGSSNSPLAYGDPEQRVAVDAVDMCP